jgi:hypothetical protein
MSFVFPALIAGHQSELIGCAFHYVTAFKDPPFLETLLYNDFVLGFSSEKNHVLKQVRQTRKGIRIAAKPDINIHGCCSGFVVIVRHEKDLECVWKGEGTG